MMRKDCQIAAGKAHEKRVREVLRLVLRSFRRHEEDRVMKLMDDQGLCVGHGLSLESGCVGEKCAAEDESSSGLVSANSSDIAQPLQENAASFEVLFEFLQDSRSRFTRREDFNFFVCNELASRGIVPTLGAVMRYGRWGRNTSVAADVRAWLKTAARSMRADADVQGCDGQLVAPSLLREKWAALFSVMWDMALVQARAEQAAGACGPNALGHDDGIGSRSGCQ